MNSLDDLADYIINAVKEFKKNPADTDFKRGYLGALEDVAEKFDIVLDLDGTLGDTK